MKQVVMSVLTTGGIYSSGGVSEKVPGHAGKIVAARFSGEPGDTIGEITVYEQVDGIDRAVMSFTDLVDGRTMSPAEEAVSALGGSPSGHYMDGLVVFGGLMWIEVSGSFDTVHQVRLVIDDGK